MAITQLSQGKHVDDAERYPLCAAVGSIVSVDEFLNLAGSSLALEGALAIPPILQTVWGSTRGADMWAAARQQYQLLRAFRTGPGPTPTNSTTTSTPASVALAATTAITTASSCSSTVVAATAVAAATVAVTTATFCAAVNELDNGMGLTSISMAVSFSAG